MDQATGKSSFNLKCDCLWVDSISESEHGTRLGGT